MRQQTYVNDVSFFLSNNLEIPFPHLSSNWFTDRAQNSQVFHLMLDVIIASPLQ